MKLLVVLPNWFGETLFTVPFLRALRRCRPGDSITGLGRPACRDMLLHSPHVDEVLELDELGRHAGLTGCWRLVRMLKPHRFDTAFILRRSASRTAVLAAAGIPRRIGYANGKSGWLLTQPVAGPPAGAHKAATYLPLLEAERCEPGPLTYDYTVSEAEAADARRLLAGEGLLGGAPLVILHPASNWSHKNWAPERFAALGDRLAETFGARVALTGGPGDRLLAETVQQGMRHPAVVLAGRTSVRQLAACLPHARLFVSNDTGIAHLAAALGRPLVALYGPTSPALTGPLGDPAAMRVIHHPDSCPTVPCYTDDHPGHPGMDRITVEEVEKAATELLSRT